MKESHLFPTWWANPQLDDGWPESVEEQGLVSMETQFYKQYMKDVL